MGRDVATIWSGFIFQGEVALCKAIEVINTLDIIPDVYSLCIEEEEDFSLHKNGDVEIFQVKAYIKHNYSKYKEAWKKMMLERHSDNASNNYLILHKGDIDLSKFDEGIEDDKLRTNIKAGEYTLGNIHSKLDNEIEKLLVSDNREYHVDDIALIRDYCSGKIHSLIKKRHLTKNREQVSLIEMKQWILEAPRALTENVFWHQITKNLFDNLQSGLEDYYLKEEQYSTYIDNINTAISSLEALSIPEMKRLLEDNIIPHKKVNRRDYRSSLSDFIDSVSVRDIIQQAIKKITLKPDYKSFKYITQNGNLKCEYQLTTHHDDYDLEDIAYRNRFQRDCENISRSPSTVDTDYFITKNLDMSKEKVEDFLRDQTVSPESTDEDTNWHNQLDNNCEFGFKKIDQVIIELNKDE